MSRNPETSEPPATVGSTEQERFSGILVQIGRQPVTGVTVLLATATSVGVLAGMPIEPFTMAEPVFLREPWRLLTSALPHVDIFHLAFNVYWTWVLGGVIEKRIGARRTLGLILLLALVSAATEYTVFSGGVGLSGVGYGLFGFLWALSRSDASIWESVPKSTVPLFLGWFVLCIVLTYTGYMAVANLAHGSGCIVGAMIGLGWMRLSLAVTVGALVLAAVGRPYLNIGGDRGAEYAYHAWLALDSGNNERAARLGAEAVRIDPDDGDAWLNYGVGLHGLEQFPEALAAFERAVELDPQLAEYVDIDELRASDSSTE